MRQPLVAGNWKMNGTRESAKALLQAVLQGVGSVNAAEVAICPPYLFLPDAETMLQGSGVAWGAQDVAKEEAGAYTGEVSAAMLAEFHCKYAIVGHSERRSLYGESDEIVAQKFAAARKEGIIPILCIGELLEEREQGETEAVVQRQLEAVVAHNGVAALAEAVIAYEPVWAIGTGKTASPQQAQDVHAFIRNWVRQRDEAVAAGVQLLYGGSVKGNNAAELFAMADIDGGLIGGASLNAEEFLTICRAAG